MIYTLTQKWFIYREEYNDVQEIVAEIITVAASQHGHEVRMLIIVSPIFCGRDMVLHFLHIGLSWYMVYL